MLQQYLSSGCLQALILLALLNPCAPTRLGAASLSTAAQVNAEPAEQASGTPITQWLSETDRLTGDWGGARTKLEDSGVKFSLFWNQYWAYHDRGRYSGSLDLFGQLDFGKMGLIPGGQMLIHVKNNHGNSVNPDVGAAGHPIDDADGLHQIYIDQLWYQQSTPSKLLELRFGYLDQQTILDRNAYANSEDLQFMNAFLDNNNAIIPLKIGPAAALFYNPLDQLSFVLGTAEGDSRLFHSNIDTTFDGDFDWISYFESDVKVEIPSPHGRMPGHYRFGLLYDPRSETADEGYYLSFDQMIFSEQEQGQQGMGLFCRYGWRPGDLNKFEHFWSAGAQYEGLLATRDDDVFGMGVYSAIAPSNKPGLDRETGYEVYYKASLTPTIALTPSLQYIDQPGGLKTNDDAFVAALRFRLIF